ncbi:glycosyl hydrolase family 61-domain-containing protein [Aspergillus spinulosporus]
MPYKNGYQSTDFRCNVGSEESGLQTKTYTIKAGDTVGFATDFGAQIQHPGPLQVYLSRAPGNVSYYDGSGEWFKIFELGPSAFTSDGVEWGVTGLNQFTFEIPQETPAGQYLLRIEHIGLHGASVYGVAEFYFNCAQLKILSDSTATPGPTLKAPSIFRQTASLGLFRRLRAPSGLRHPLSLPPLLYTLLRHRFLQLPPPHLQAFRL